MIPCVVASRYHHFGGTCCLCLQSRPIGYERYNQHTLPREPLNIYSVTFRGLKFEIHNALNNLLYITNNDCPSLWVFHVYMNIMFAVAGVWNNSSAI